MLNLLLQVCLVVSYCVLPFNWVTGDFCDLPIWAFSCVADSYYLSYDTFDLAPVVLWGIFRSVPYLQFGYVY